MAKYKCSVCSYIYDENVGDIKNGIQKGAKFENLPDTFRCPNCLASKEQFSKIEE